jgi:hypothetical protein
MSNIKNRLTMVLFIMISAAIRAQGTSNANSIGTNYDVPKLIPDKFLEIGLPLLFLFLVLNIIVTIIKNREENKLKLKAIDKGISEETLIKLFKESQVISKLQPLKMFLITGSLGISLLLIYLLNKVFADSSGFVSMGIILVLMSLGFYTFYYILNRKLQ